MTAIPVPPYTASPAVPADLEAFDDGAENTAVPDRALVALPTIKAVTDRATGSTAGKIKDVATASAKLRDDTTALKKNIDATASTTTAAETQNTANAAAVTAASTALGNAKSNFTALVKRKPHGILHYQRMASAQIFTLNSYDLIPETSYTFTPDPNRYYRIGFEHGVQAGNFPGVRQTLQLLFCLSEGTEVVCSLNPANYWMATLYQFDQVNALDGQCDVYLKAPKAVKSTIGVFGVVLNNNTTISLAWSGLYTVEDRGEVPS